MARPQKDGLEYFPLNTDIDQDDKLQLIEAQFGITGFGIVIKLLMKIYREGYYYEWSEKEQLLFSRRVNVDINEVNDVINECLKWDLFDLDMYEQYGILTSRGIQRRYFEAVNRRKVVEVIKEYCLIDLKNQTNIVYVNINLINVNKNPLSQEVNADTGTQSKVKESKVKETITTPISPSETFDDQFSGGRDIFISFEKEFGRLLSPFEIEMLRSWINTFNADLILYALKIATLGQNRSFRYIQGILTRWQGEGVKCVQEVEILEKRHQEEKRKRAGPVKNTSVADQNKNVLEAVFGGQE